MAAALGLLAGPATAASPVALDFAVYLGGMRVLDSQVTLSIGEESYSVGMTARPRGVASWLDRWTYEASARGTVLPVRSAAFGEASATALPVRSGAFRTVRHRSDGTSRGRTVTFLADGTTAIADDPPRRSPPPSLPAEVLAGAVDPLSVMVVLAEALGAGAGCPATVPVWDGAHRFDLRFTDLGLRSLTAQGVRGYSGEAHLCRGQLVPVAGDFEDSDSDSFWRRPAPGEDPRLRQLDLWLASPAPGALPVLVRAEGLTSVGPLIIHLQSSYVY